MDKHNSLAGVRSRLILAWLCACALLFSLCFAMPFAQAYADGAVLQAASTNNERTQTLITVSGYPPWLTADAGDSFTLVPTVQTSLYEVVEGAQCTFSSSNPEVASVDGSTVTARAIGKTQITCTFAGNDAYAPSENVATLSVYGGTIEESGLTAHILANASEGQPGTCKVCAIGSDALSPDGKLVIPGSLNDSEGWSYAVTEIGFMEGSGSASPADAVLSTLTSLDIPACVQRIDNRAFMGCTQLKQVTISQGSQLAAIDNSAFYGCNALEAIDLSECAELKAVGDYAFAQCSTLASVNFPSDLESIGRAAFYRCGSLASVVIPASVVELGRNASWYGLGAFSWCSALESVVIEEGSCLEAMPFAFYECQNLANLDLGEGVKVIGWSAFYNCQSLSEVTIPASVELIGTGSAANGAFAHCSSLQKVTVAEGSKLTSAVGAFTTCAALREADVSAASGLKDFYRMFSGCSALETLKLPDVAALDMSIAEGCPSLAGVTVPSGATELCQDEGGAIYSKDGSMLIYYPAALKTVQLTLPAGCVSLGPNALRYNTSLERLAFTTASDDGFIEEYALADCTALVDVAFAGDTFGRIGTYAFRGCTALESIDIPGLTAQEAYSDYYTDRGNQVYSSGYIISPTSTRSTVKTPGFGEYTFSGCTALKSVRFGADPDLGCYALVDKATNIFSGCTALESIAFDGKQPYWMNDDASIGCRTQGSGFYTYAQILPYFGDYDHAPYYYAVNYYLTREQAETDDAGAEKRIARTEFLRGTSVSSIATGDTSLAGTAVYERAPKAAGSDYQDGSVLDPNEVAQANGMQGSDWVWAFEEHCGEYGDLYESCYVYLAHADDLGICYMEAAPLSAMRQPISSTISTSFDANRWFGENKYGEDYVPVNFTGDTFIYKNCFESGYYNQQQGYGTLARERFEGSCYFTWGSNGLVENMTVRAADGTELKEGKDYVVTCQRAVCDEGSGAVHLEDVERMVIAGPYLLTFTALDGGACEAGSSYSRWVLVKPHSETVSVYDQRGGSDAGATASAARQPYSVRPVLPSYTMLAYTDTYSVTTSSNDTISAVLGCEIAGLARANIKIGSDNDISAKDGGFIVETASQKTSWKRGNESIADMAAWTYEHFNESMGSFGFTERPWGSAALLANAQDESIMAGLSTYCYQMKAPMFFLDDAGKLNERTIGCLKDFERVIIVGDEQLMPDALESQVAEAGVASVERMSYAAGDICGLSIAAAEALMDEGVNASVGAVSDARDRMDLIAANDYIGFVGGISLAAASTADAKRVVAWLYGMRDNVSEVRVYGREDGVFADYDIAAAIMPNGFDSENRVWNGNASIWDVDMAAVIAERTAVGPGDTVGFNGMQLTIGSDGALSYDGTCFYGAEPLLKGQSIACPTLTVDVGRDMVVAGVVERELGSVPDGYKADAQLGVSASSLELVAGDTARLDYLYSGDGALSAASSNEEASTVQLSDGAMSVGALKYGSADITLSAAETDLYKAASCTVSVDVSRAKQIITVEEAIDAQTYDDPFALNASALGDVPLTYKIDKASVAIVDESGVVTIVGVGSATITVTAARTDAYTNATAKVALTVTKGLPKNTITVSADSFNKTVGDASFSLGAKARGNAELSFASSDEAVATVDGSGAVTPIGAGEAAITVTSAQTSTYRQTSLVVTVKVAVASGGDDGKDSNPDDSGASRKAQKVTAKKTTVTKTYKAAKSGKLKNKLSSNKTFSAKTVKKLFGLSAQGVLVFKKANKAGAAKITVSAAGKVVAKKGLKKGKYKVKIAVNAKATSVYEASSVKCVFLVLKVK